MMPQQSTYEENTKKIKCMIYSVLCLLDLNMYQQTLEITANAHVIFWS